MSDIKNVASSYMKGGYDLTKTGKSRGIWMLTIGQFQVTPKLLYQNEASFRILRYFIELQNMKYF